MDNNTENQDSTNIGENQELDQTLDSELDAEAKLKALEEQNKRLYARAKKAEEELKKGKTSAPKIEPSQQNINNNPTDIDKRFEQLELVAKGYTDDEIAFIQQNGGKGALSNPFVKASLDAIRAQRQAEHAAIDTDSGKSELEKKYTEDQIKNMSVKDLEKILPKS